MRPSNGACCSRSSSLCNTCPVSGSTRRGFLAAIAGAAMLPLGRAAQKDPIRQQPVVKALKVQPVLVYKLPQRREGTSWRQWGGLQTEQDVAQEKARIQRELSGMAKLAGFPLDVAPLVEAQGPEEGGKIARGDQDVTLMYAAGDGQKTLEALTSAERWNLMFLRHDSGPTYLWYEIADPRFLRKTNDVRTQPGMGIEDVVVDSQSEILLRLRGLHGLKNTLNKKMVAIGGPAGWGAAGRNAPQVARDLWKMDLQTVSYPDLGVRIQKARADAAVVSRATAAAEKYLRQPGIKLVTAKEFVTKAFLLTEVFRDILDEAQTDAMTINQCMGTIMKYSETSACLPLSILNDEGYMAFCESDFVVIPSGVLLRYIANKPVFLNDPTHPHDKMVTLAHCTAPRKNDGKAYDPAKILTHFESDYGASPKVDMKLGQRLTVIDPDFASKKWVGFEGEVIANPFLPICRSQIDVQIKGDTGKLLEEMRGFHWMSCYGNYLKETGYALKKMGIEWAVV